MNDDCLFCKIVRGEIPCASVYQNDHVLAFLDINPLCNGHCLLIPKQHVCRLEECSPSVMSVLACEVPRLVEAVVKATGADGCNLLNNNGRSAGQLVDHVHFHIIPRKEGDGLFQHADQGQYPPGRMDEVAELIRRQL